MVTGEGNGNPLQYSHLENPIDKQSGRLQSMGSHESDMTQPLNHAPPVYLLTEISTFKSI